MLKKFMFYKPGRKDRSYSYGKMVSIVRLDVWVAIMVHCILKKKHEGPRQKESGDTYARIVESATKQLSRNIREFLKQVCLAPDDS